MPDDTLFAANRADDGLAAWAIATSWKPRAKATASRMPNAAAGRPADSLRFVLGIHTTPTLRTPSSTQRRHFRPPAAAIFNCRQLIYCIGSVT